MRRLVACLAVGLVIVAAVPAAVTARPTAEYDFYDCTGSGPDSFTAVKTATPPESGGPVSSGGAFAATDGSGTFVVLSFGEGNFDPPGIDVSGAATTECLVDTSVGTLLYSGIWVPTP
jgi:hypothetical protein